MVIGRGRTSLGIGRPTAASSRALAATVTAAGVLGASTWFGSWTPLALVLALCVVLATVVWVQWIVRRDARAVVVLWLVFALNRSVALLAPAALESLILPLDDVALAIAFVVLVVTGSRLAPASPAMTVAYIGFGVFAGSGLAGALAAGTDPRTALLGTWLALKLFVCLVVTSQFNWRDRDIRLAVRVAIPLTVVALGTALVQWVSPGTVNAVFGTEGRTRLGASVISSVFRQPAQYSTFMIFAYALLLARYPLNPRRLAQAGVVGASALLSLRLKSLIDVVLLMAARVAVSPSRVVKGSFPLVLLLGGASAAYVGSGLLDSRLGVLFGVGEKSARQVLYTTSASIARDHYPLGGGFGSFGSEASLVDYSPLYADYGLSEMYGFSADAPIFVHDASWATVLGETGLIGLGGFAVALAALLLSAWRMARLGRGGRRADAARASFLFALAFTADSLTTPQLFTGFACMSLAALLSMSRVRSSPSEPPRRRTDVMAATTTPVMR